MQPLRFETHVTSVQPLYIPTSANILSAALFYLPQQVFWFIQQMTIDQVLPSSHDPLNNFHLHPTLNTKTLHFSIDLFMQLCPL